jgi:hypothetical protein
MHDTIPLMKGDRNVCKKLFFSLYAWTLRWYLAFDLEGGYCYNSCTVRDFIPITYEYDRTTIHWILFQLWGIPYMTHDFNSGAVHHMIEQHVTSHD